MSSKFSDALATSRELVHRHPFDQRHVIEEGARGLWLACREIVMIALRPTRFDSDWQARSAVPDVPSDELRLER